MSRLICPVCGEGLTFGDRAALCGKGHSFDLAREGYVNLLQSQKSSAKRHGDDKLMLAARRKFLSGGHYDFLLEALAEAPEKPDTGSSLCLLDVGCGEGYYTEGLYRRLTHAGQRVEMTAVDISKEAARLTAKRDFPKETAVASAYSLPVAGGSCDGVINLFAPMAAAEFRRVLKPDGTLYCAVPRERHLWGLKAAIYDKPYLNPPVDPDLTGFRTEQVIELDRTIRLTDPGDIDALFRMTPYYYKTSAENQARAAKLERLETEVSFALILYKML